MKKFFVKPHDAAAWFAEITTNMLFLSFLEQYKIKETNAGYELTAHFCFAILQILRQVRPWQGTCKHLY